MAVTNDASEAVRALIAHRWRGQVVSRAATTLIERRDELPDALADEVVRALTERKDDRDE